MMRSLKTVGALVATVLVGVGGPATAQTASSPSSKPATEWVDWTSATTGLAATATGTLGSITVKYTGQIAPAAQTSGGFNYWVPSTPFLSSQVSHQPPTPDIIRNAGGSGAGTYTVTFSQPVKNPVMAIVSLGRRWQPRTYVFIDAPFDVLSSGKGFWGGDANSLVELPGNVLQGEEGHGIIQFTGTFTSIRWTVPTAEAWHGFTFGIPVPQNQPPVANAGADQTLECVAGGVKVTLDGSGSSDPDGDTLDYSWTGPFGTASGVRPTVTLNPGLHTVTLTVNDGKGGTTSDSATIKISDTAPPQISSVAVNPAILGSVNHKMVSVSVTTAATDSCDATPTCLVYSVSSNEPLNATGDGNTEEDWALTGDTTVDLRAESAGTGTGRVYTITAVCGDDSGNSTTKTIEVPVRPDGEQLWLESNTNTPITTKLVLKRGEPYLLTLQGTYSMWANFATTGRRSGKPGPTPIFPSAKGANTLVGMDPEFYFAWPSNAAFEVSAEPAPRRNALIEVSLDGGKTWKHPATTAPFNATDHKYTYELTGDASALQVRMTDKPVGDNYGRIQVVVQPGT